MWAGQDVSYEEKRDDEEESSELKKLHSKRLVILTDEGNPHTFPILISDCLADLHLTDAYFLAPQEELEKDGWARTRLARGRAGEQ